MKKVFRIIRLILYLCLYLGFIFIPLAFIEARSLCYTYSKFHFVCPACGITRAFSALMHGRFILAYKYNPIFTCAIFPISSFIFIQDIISILKSFIKKERNTSIIEFILGGIKHDL